MKLFKLIVGATLFGISLMTHAQIEQAEATCPAGIPETADASKLLILPNGEVLHIASNLIFMRCSIGQTWDESTCVDEPTAFTWQQALIASTQNTFNDSTNWRLPNVKELNVITERSCVRPSINDELFPNTSPDDYWTSTPSIQNGEMAWSVAFTNASNSPRLKTRSLFVRLVRTRLSTE